MPLATSPPCPCFFLGRVPFAQLLALPVDDADVDRELIADDRAAALALGEFNPLDLRWKLATFSHRRGMRPRRADSAGVMTPPRCARR